MINEIKNENDTLRNDINVLRQHLQSIQDEYENKILKIKRENKEKENNECKKESGDEEKEKEINKLQKEKEELLAKLAKQSEIEEKSGKLSSENSKLINDLRDAK